MKHPEIPPLGNRSTQILHLFVLSSFAIAQPIFAVLRESPSFFVARRAGALDLILMTCGLLFLPPAALAVLVLTMAKVRPSFGDWTQKALVGATLALIALPMLANLPSWQMAVFGGGIVGTGAAIPYARYVRFRQIVAIGAPAPLLFAGLFLFTPPISGLVFLPDPERSISKTKLSDAPVIFLLLDELPTTSLLNLEGNIDSARYPNFAALASRSTWFPNATTVADLSENAIPAILTGNFHREGTLPTAADHPRNLFTLLAGSYRIQAIEPITHLCVPQICDSIMGRPASWRRRARALLETTRQLYPRILLPGRYADESAADRDVLGEFVNAPWEINHENLTAEEFRETQDEVHADAASKDQVRLFKEFTSSMVPGDRQLYFLHLFLPHSPYRHLPGGLTYTDPGIPGRDEEQWISPWFAIQGYQRHLLQLKRVDELLGELIAHLDRTQMSLGSLLVVMADHGVSFRPGEKARHATPANIGDVGLTPLFIKAPDQKSGTVDPRPVRSIDVLPAVAELLGLDLPWEVDGLSPFSNSMEGLELIVREHEGEMVPFPSPDEARREGARRLSEIFGPPSGVLDLFAFGRYGNLVGLEKATLEPVIRPSGVAARIDGLDAFGSVDLSTSQVPAYLEATITGLRRDMRHVAIVLNDVVATVVPVHQIRGRNGRVAAMLPGPLFVNGTNTIEMLAVTGDSLRPALTAVRVR